MEIDTDRIDNAVLALLTLTLDDDGRAWKTYDWDALARLHARGLIADPANRAKSVILTEEGEARARLLFQQMFTRSGSA